MASNYGAISFGHYATGVYGQHTKPVDFRHKIKTDDLVSLRSCENSVISKTLKDRVLENRIYTYIDDVLIAVNPCENVPLYEENISNEYRKEHSMKSLIPHVYGTAESMRRQLITTGLKQYCFVSGESGSGKTESCKHLLHQVLSNTAGDASGNVENLLEKIQGVNPLLEAFGNARTEMNNNSSRFAKYMEVTFSLGDNHVLGADIGQFMLEKSRVVYQNKSEQNFHIFLMLVAGSEEFFDDLQLHNNVQYRYLNEEKSSSAADLQKRLRTLIECMQFIGFQQDDIHNIFKILAAILLLGEVRVKVYDDNAVLDEHSMAKVEELLGVSDVNVSGDTKLSDVLSHTIQVNRGEKILSHKNKKQVLQSVDALAKSLYSCTFSWIVNFINNSFYPKMEDNTSKIGILDIFGFENLQFNSLEQLCINIANERMHKHLNEHIFVKEVDDCREEGLPSPKLSFFDNTMVLEALMSKNLGLLSLLEDESKLTAGSVKSLANKISNRKGTSFANGTITPDNGNNSFIVKHFAGSVVYQLTGVIEKNRDIVPDQIPRLMARSSNPLVSDLYDETDTVMQQTIRVKGRRGIPSEYGSTRSFKDIVAQMSKQSAYCGVGKKSSKMKAAPRTLVKHFQSSLNKLLSNLENSKPHFIRCIKPNRRLAPPRKEYDSEYVQDQLKYTGISSVAKIRNHGYPIRISFEDFLERYNTIFQMISKGEEVSDKKGAAQVILDLCLVKAAFVGKKKIFLKNEDDELLLTTMESYDERIKCIQAFVRWSIAAKQCEAAREEQKDDYVPMDETTIDGSIYDEVTDPNDQDGEEYSDAGTEGHGARRRSPDGFDPAGLRRRRQSGQRRPSQMTPWSPIGGAVDEDSAPTMPIPMSIGKPRAADPPECEPSQPSEFEEGDDYCSDYENNEVGLSIAIAEAEATDNCDASDYLSETGDNQPEVVVCDEDVLYEDDIDPRATDLPPKTMVNQEIGSVSERPSLSSTGSASPTAGESHGLADGFSQIVGGIKQVKRFINSKFSGKKKVTYDASCDIYEDIDMTYNSAGHSAYRPIEPDEPDELEEEPFEGTSLQQPPESLGRRSGFVKMVGNNVQSIHGARSNLRQWSTEEKYSKPTKLLTPHHPSDDQAEIYDYEKAYDGSCPSIKPYAPVSPSYADGCRSAHASPYSPGAGDAFSQSATLMPPPQVPSSPSSPSSPSWPPASPGRTPVHDEHALAPTTHQPRLTRPATAFGASRRPAGAIQVMPTGIAVVEGATDNQDRQGNMVTNVLRKVKDEHGSVAVKKKTLRGAVTGLPPPPTTTTSAKCDDALASGVTSELAEKLNRMRRKIDQ